MLALTARYKRELKWVCLALMLPAVPGVFIRDFGLNMLLWMIWILVICVAVNIPYVRCNRALRRLKADRGWRREPSGQAGGGPAGGGHGAEVAVPPVVSAAGGHGPGPPTL